MSVIYGPPIWETPGSSIPRGPPSWFCFTPTHAPIFVISVPYGQPIQCHWPNSFSTSLPMTCTFILLPTHFLPSPTLVLVFWNYSASSYFFSNFNFHSFILTPRTPFPWPCWALQSLRASTRLQGSFWPSLTQFFHTLQTHPAGRSSINFDCLFCSYTQAAKHSWENNTIT